MISTRFRAQCRDAADDFVAKDVTATMVDHDAEPFVNHVRR